MDRRKGEMTMDGLTPKDHAEAVAVFRSEVVGSLCRRDLGHGDLRAEFVALAQQRFRVPGGDVTRTISIPTLERWYYAYRRGGLPALQPRPRTDRGRGRRLTAEQRQLLLDIRRENPSASVPLILRTLTLDGRLDRGAISAATVRRLYAEQGLDRVAMRDSTGAHTRLRWQAERPGALWHGDVCHGPALIIGGKPQPLRIHGMLDDASRFVVALEAMHTEREVDMLGLLSRSVRRHGLPDALYLDNGSTYSGATLRLACERLGITLIHARPYSPEARGKMERFWRTLRESVLDHLGSMAALHDVNVRLWAFLDQHYHQAPHAGLLGRSPASVWQAAEHGIDDLDEQRLRCRAHRDRATSRPPRHDPLHRRHHLAARSGLSRRPHRHRRSLPRRRQHRAVGRARRQTPRLASRRSHQERAHPAPASAPRRRHPRHQNRVLRSCARLARQGRRPRPRPQRHRR